MRASLFAIVLGIILGLAACVSPPEYPIEPVIEFVSMSKTTLQQGFQAEDTLSIVFSFTDGDGDIGTDENDLNLTLIDSRTGLEGQLYRVPTVPNPNEKYGISGEIILQVYSICCQHPTLNESCDVWADYPVDELYYDIQMWDRAGNGSNIISTNVFQVICD